MCVQRAAAARASPPCSPCAPPGLPPRPCAGTPQNYIPQRALRPARGLPGAVVPARGVPASLHGAAAHAQPAPCRGPSAPAAVGLAPRPLGWGGLRGAGARQGPGAAGRGCEGLREAPGPGGGGSSEGRAAPGGPRGVCGAEGSAAPGGAASPRGALGVGSECVVRGAHAQVLAACLEGTA